MKHYTIRMSTDNEFDDSFLMSDLGTGLDGNFEIYEGDYLLTTWDLGDDKDPLEDFGEVQFVDSAWTVVSPNGDDLLHEWVDNGTSVQGNIHEQPEWRV